MSESLIALLTALGDDELVIGHRHSEWTGFAPHIEEDVAFSSIAQDEIGHAGGFYSLISALGGSHPDDIALGRPKADYRNAILCERDNGDWSYSLARHWLYDHADDLRLEALEASAHKDLADLVRKIRREERYHLLHADTWMRRVAGGPVDGRSKMIEALTHAFAETAGLFEPLETEDDAVKEGWLPVPTDELHRRFVDRMGRALDELGLPTDIGASLEASAEFVASSSGDLIVRAGGHDGESRPPRPGLGGRRGRHSEDFDRLWDDLTHTYRNHPGASW